MLKKLTLVCGLLLAATTVMAWDRLSDLPNHVDVDTGAHLTWGDTLLWGVFPSTGSPDATYLASFNPRVDPEQEDPWDTLRISGVRLHRSGIAFQWKEQPVVWLMGKDDPGISRLYRYDVGTGTCTQDTIEYFTLGMGACMTYVPNHGYNVYSYPVPGWLCFLPGGGPTFWRYWIPAEDMPDPLVYGYEYPGDGVTIADPTPPFRWSPSATPNPQYRLQVSTDFTFSGTPSVIDTVVSTAECQSSVELDSGTYYWRVGNWIQGSGGGYWDYATIGCRCIYRHFGWDSLPNIDHNALNGARLAYCDADKPFDHDAIVAMYGGDSKYLSEYSIGGGYWTSLANTPWNITIAASLTTTLDTAVGGDEAGYRIYAAFGHSVEGDCPYYYHNGTPDGWDPLDHDDVDSTYDTHFPDDIDPGSSMALGANDMMYLTTGYGKRFYGVDVSSFSGGEQARTVPSGRARAQAVTVREGVEVEYQLPVTARVRATLHDAVGRRIGFLDAGELKAGTHRLSFNRDNEGRRLSTGAYFVLLDMGREQARLKTVVE